MSGVLKFGKGELAVEVTIEKPYSVVIGEIYAKRGTFKSGDNISDDTMICQIGQWDFETVAGLDVVMAALDVVRDNLVKRDLMLSNRIVASNGDGASNE